jgi:hypothetical protein
MDSTAAAIYSLITLHNETIGLLRAIVCRHRAFTDSADRNDARACKIAADKCHTAIGAAAKYLDRIDDN